MSAPNKGTPAVPRTINIAALSGTNVESEFRDFMAELFAAATMMQSLRRKAARVFSLSSSELAIVLAVSKLGNHKSIREIAEHLDISASNVTSDVGHLVGAGYLRKAADPADARAIIVSLTPAGTKLIRNMAPVLQFVNNTIFSDMSHDDMIRCSAVLKAIVQKGRHITTDDINAFEPRQPAIKKSR
jgi:DNA-binding MarR family transcriptional regulator